jgi:hypothetical protein
MRPTGIPALAIVVGMALGAPQSFPQQPIPKAQTTPSPTPTPEQREARKHYRTALEALKNDDWDIALKELNSAAELTPKNALIWYNVAVVESKKGDPGPALEHLRKAASLGLPKGMQDDADQLEAKLSYAVQKAAEQAEITTCLNGIWREQYEPPKSWLFTVDGDSLTIQRTDNFVSGTLSKNGDNWIGQIRWGSGEVWPNIVLTPSPDCTQVHTNQSWWYRR